jgi:MerR family redox-sensitive transcriptional activator SoxR
VRKGDELLSIGEMARRSGMAVSAIRYYESQGLLPAQRTSGNTRRFPRHTLRRLALIQVASRYGVTLSEVAEIFTALPQDRAPTKRDWQRISRHWCQQLEQRKHALTRMQEELTGCIGCGCLSLQTCVLLNPQDRLFTQGPGPRRLLDGNPSGV